MAILVTTTRFKKDRLIGDGMAEGWSFDDCRYEAGLDISHFHPVSLFESENGSAQSSYATEFTISRSSSYTDFRYGENNYFDLTCAQQEATEMRNWLPISDTIAVYTHFRQEIHNADGKLNIQGLQWFPITSDLHR